MTQINAYLAFDGNCKEAMTFYKECLGGELFLQTVGESPAAGEMPKETHNKVMHAGLSNGGILLMASDMMKGEKYVIGNAVSLSLNCDTEEEIKRFFSKLSAGGKVTQPLEAAFWGATFGMLTDKFGMNWMLNYEKPKA